MKPGKTPPDNKNRIILWLSRIITRLFSLTTYTPRTSLIIIAIIIMLTASSFSSIAFVLNDTVFYMFGMVFWIIWFTLLLVIAIPQTDSWLQNKLRMLKKAAVTIIFLLFFFGIIELTAIFAVGLDKQVNDGDNSFSIVLNSLNETFNYNDATALCHQASENFLNGDNPYAESNIARAMLEYHIPSSKLTPLRAGVFTNIFPYPEMEQMESLMQDVMQNPEVIPVELESSLSYPAGCFLIPAAFLFVGIDDLRLVYLILLVPALIYILWLTPSKYRLLLGAFILISLELWNSLAAGETGLLLFPFLLLGWVLPARNLWISAPCMGLASTIKQVAWFLIPFYLVLIYKTQGAKKMFQSLAVIALVFVAANAPFIINDPHLWYTSVLAPMSEEMFPIGIGFVTMVTGGLIDIQSPVIFGIVEGMTLLAGIIWYSRNCEKYPQTGPLLAILPLFFAWRSLWPYFFYVDIMILASILINEYSVNRMTKIA